MRAEYPAAYPDDSLLNSEEEAKGRRAINRPNHLKSAALVAPRARGSYEQKQILIKKLAQKLCVTREWRVFCPMKNLNKICERS